MNYKEILKKIKDAGISSEEFAYGDFTSPEGVGEFKEVFSKGGEDEGSDWRRVYFFKDHGVYIEAHGFYSSYNGTDFTGDWEDDVQEVKPVEKTVTVYE